MRFPTMWPKPVQTVVRAFIQWFDADYRPGQPPIDQLPDRIELGRCIPFITIHLGCLAVFFVGWSWVAVGTAIGLYLIRMFAITAFYHRYFSHKTFHTSRTAQFVFALLGASAGQRGPLWWAYHHRCHHQCSDQKNDVHSPRQHGFWWAHIGWITSTRNFPTDYRRVRDLAKFPELVFLNRFDSLIPILLVFGLYGAGKTFELATPEWGISGLQMITWGFCISTTVLFHATSSINSLAHLMGKRRYPTDDYSGNSFILALITLGEGWHNNHHRFMSSMRQGFRWWEIDVTYYLLKVFSWCGIIWNTHDSVPEKAFLTLNQFEP